MDLEVEGPRGTEEIEFVIDTGFDDPLSLPSFAIHRLGLRRLSRRSAALADGSLIQFDVYEAHVLWHGEWVYVPVHEADTDPLIGMALLNGSDLRITARRVGAVGIAPLP